MAAFDHLVIRFNGIQESGFTYTRSSHVAKQRRTNKDKLQSDLPRWTQSNEKSNYFLTWTLLNLQKKFVTSQLLWNGCKCWLEQRKLTHTNNSSVFSWSVIVWDFNVWTSCHEHRKFCCTKYTKKALYVKLCRLVILKPAGSSSQWELFSIYLWYQFGFFSKVS